MTFPKTNPDILEGIDDQTLQLRDQLLWTMMNSQFGNIDLIWFRVDMNQLLMLSPQPHSLQLNSSNELQNGSRFHMGTHSSSSSLLKSLKMDQQQPQISEIENKKYSKLLKQKDLKIINLSERLKVSQSELEKYRTLSRSLEYDLNFFKSKIQEEFYRNVCKEDEIEIINTCLKQSIIKIVSILEKSDHSMQSFAKYLESIQQAPAQESPVDTSRKLLNGLEFQITQITKSFHMLKKEPNNQNLLPSADCRLEQYKKADEMEKEVLKKHINHLIDFYETKMIDTEDYKKEIENLRRQRQFTKELLVSSQREKNQYLNGIYEVARREFKVDFETMNKSQIIRLSMKLFSRIRDLEKDNVSLTIKNQLLETTEKNKYEKILKSVRQLEKASPLKTSNLRRLGSLPTN